MSELNPTSENEEYIAPAVEALDPVQAADLLIPLVRNPKLLSEMRDAVKPQVWLSKTHRAFVKIVLEIFDLCQAVPSQDILVREASKQEDKDNLLTLIERCYAADVKHVNYHTRELASHLERVAHESAAARYTSLVKQGKFRDARRAVAQASSVGKKRKTVNYFDEKRVAQRFDPEMPVYNRRGVFKTGFAYIDEPLYGGPAYGEIYMFIADYGRGKTRKLQNCAASMASFGAKIFFASLEVHTPVLEGRFDQIYTGLPVEELRTDLGRERLRQARENIALLGGGIWIGEWAEGECGIDELAAELHRLEAEEGIEFDAVYIDFVDKMKIRASSGGGNRWSDQEEHFNEVRGRIAREFDVIVITASQTNKQGEYFGAQGKMGALDGSWQIEMSDEDDLARRFRVRPKKIRINYRFGSGEKVAKCIIGNDGMSVHQITGDWPEEHLTGAEKSRKERN